MAKKEFISAEQTPIPGYAGEVQDETTSSSIGGDIDIGSKVPKGVPEAQPQTQEQTQAQTQAQTETSSVRSPALAPQTSPAWSPQTSPAFNPYGGLSPVPGLNPVPVPVPVPEDIPTGRSKGGEKLSGTDAPPPLEPVAEPKRTLGEVLSDAKGQYARDFQQTLGTTEKFAEDFTNYGPQALLGGALLATGAGAVGAVAAPSVVAAGGAAVAKGAQSIEELIESTRAGKTVFGGGLGW